MNKTKRLKPVRHTSAPQNTETTTLAPASGAPATVASTSSILMAMPVPGIDRGHAARANFFHRLSREAGIVAIRAAIAAGVELLEAKREYPGGFQKWVESKCDFGVATAYRYMEVAKKTLPEIDRLLYLPSGDRVPAIEAAATSTDSRTLTDLYVDIGIVKRTPSKMGGARPGAGRPPKSSTEAADLETHRKETLHELGAHLAVLDRATGPGGGCLLLPLADLNSLKKELSGMLKRVEEMIQKKLSKGR